MLSYLSSHYKLRSRVIYEAMTDTASLLLSSSSFGFFSKFAAMMMAQKYNPRFLFDLNVFRQSDGLFKSTE